MANIYIVEDDTNIQEIEAIALKNSGHSVEQFDDAAHFYKKLEEKLPDLAILDLMLPDEDGYEIVKKLRQNPATKKLPVIMVTAKTSEIDMVRGLDIGADDYILKPFNPLEVLARVKTQLRRYTKYNQVETVVEEKEEHDIKGLVINKTTHECTLFGEKIELTPIEFSILWYLCENRGKVVSSEELFEQVWGEKYYDSNNTVMAHIGRLREKLHEPPRKPKFVKTVWGVGYKVE